MAPAHSSKWGLVAIDGEEAFLGKASSPEDFVQVARVASLAHFKHKCGGQSAPRFQRQRQGCQRAFLRRVAEKATEHFADAAQILIGGKAENKVRLLAELRPTERSRVLQLLPMACDSSCEACAKLAREIESSKRMLQVRDERGALEQFMDCLDRDLQDSYCYGADQCALALRLGAVQLLLLAENCSLGQELQPMARSTRASTITVSPTTAAGHRFCQGVGMGALLRWPIAALELEEWCKDAESDGSTTDGGDCVVDEIDFAIEASNSYEELDCWLIQSLCEHGLGHSSAEALACVVSVTLELSDDAMEHRVERACELLRNEGVHEKLLHEMAARIATQHSLFD